MQKITALANSLSEGEKNIANILKSTIGTGPGQHEHYGPCVPCEELFTKLFKELFNSSVSPYANDKKDHI